jgi:MGT family glycosyltransferase
MKVSLKRSEYGYRMVGPELVLGPKAIDFPDPADMNQRCYAGICVDEARKDCSFDASALNLQKPLIYCSLGTHSSHYHYSKRLYECLFEAMEQLKDYHLLLQAEGFERQLYSGAIPGNVSIFHNVPQLELLKRAKLFITHGGFSSVREGIFYGVPMIVFPGWHDQPGNAARVVYHGLGKKANMKNITTTKLVTIIKEVLSNEQILHAVRQMQKMSRDTKEFQLAIQFIESFLDRSAPSFLTSPRVTDHKISLAQPPK